MSVEIRSPLDVLLLVAKVVYSKVKSFQYAASCRPAIYANTMYGPLRSFWSF